VRFEVRIAGDAGAALRFGEYLQRPLALKHRRHRHAAQCDPVDFFLCEHFDAVPEGRQLVLERLQTVPGQVEACRHQHHALGRDAVELVRVHVGVDVRDDVAQLVPGVDDGHC
jgi:hypothetical protein